MNCHIVARLLACTVLSSAAFTPALASDIERVDGPGGKSVIAGAISADGSVVVGTINPSQNPSSVDGRGFRWTPATAMRVFAEPGPFSRFTATGVSNDGGYIVGSATADMLEQNASAGAARAYRWSASGGFQDLGSLSAGAESRGKAISGDGKVVVGSSGGTYSMTGFRWEEGSGMQALPGNFADQHPMATSYDGSVVIGTRTYPDIKAIRWKKGVGTDVLPLFREDTSSWAYDVSDDGAVIVGWTDVQAVRWTDAGIFSLGHLGDRANAFSVAYGVSGNGEVIVGMAGNGSAVHDPYRGFRWTEGTGMQTVEDWLRASGAVITSDMTYLARSTNCDGSIVVGETGIVHGLVGTPPSALFIARGTGTGRNDCRTAGGNSGGGNSGGGNAGGEDPGGETPGGQNGGGQNTGGQNTGGENTGGQNTGGQNTGGQNTGGQGAGGVGLILVDDFNTTLADAGAASTAMLGNVNLLLNGAGSRPLDRRADPGRSLTWLGGDWGRLDDGDIGLGEIGAGHNFGGLQINAVVGFSRFDQTTALGGKSDLSAGYVKAEALANLYATGNGGLWGAFTASALWGHADMERNYLNGGLLDTSYGSTDTSGYGLRARLQWENAVDYVSPYADISHVRGCFDAYTETGGGFPASFGKLCDGSTELRYGFDVTYPLSSELRLIGTLEGVHRFDDKSANVTGVVTGLYAFDLGSVSYQQNWLRAGAGFEADIGGSTLSLMGNVTSQSQSAKAWVAANWRMKF